MDFFTRLTCLKAIVGCSRLLLESNTTAWFPLEREKEGIEIFPYRMYFILLYKCNVGMQAVYIFNTPEEQQVQKSWVCIQDSFNKLNFRPGTMDDVLILNSLIFNNSINQGSYEFTVMWNVTNTYILGCYKKYFLKKKSNELCKFILYFWNLVAYLLFLGMAILDTTSNFYGTNMEDIITLARYCEVYFSFNMNYHTINATPIMAECN